MASSTTYSCGLKLKVLFTSALLINFTFSYLCPRADGGDEGNSRTDRAETSVEEGREMMVGSRPPGCVNKCKKCRPCMATLVVVPGPHVHSDKDLTASYDEGGDTYYLLSWRCKCGNKLFQP